MDSIYSFFFDLRTNVYDHIFMILTISLIATLGIFCFYVVFNSKDKNKKTYLDLIKIKSITTYNDLLNNKKVSRVLKAILISFSIFCTCTYIIWRIFVSLPLNLGWIAVFLSLLLLVVEVSEFISSYIVSVNHLHVQNYKCPTVPKKNFCDVDVFVCTYNEPVDVLKKTLNACLHMSYPKKEKVHIYLCDDKNRTAMKNLAKTMGVNYIGRKINTNAKAGNINNALSKSSSKYVAIFDADMIPKNNFLLQTIPYFLDAEKVNDSSDENNKIELGFVQSPQHFYHPDMFQRSFNAQDKVVSEQDFFHKEIQRGKTYSNSVYCCGTNCVFNRQALEDIGGFYTNSITEDIATGLLLQNQGYVSVCTTEILAQGMNPTSFADLIKQRKRWACGCTSTCNNLKKLKKNMSLLQRMSFNSVKSFWFYPFKSIVVLTLPVITALFGLFIFQCSLIDLLIFWGGTYFVKILTWTILKSNRQSYIVDKVVYLSTSFGLFVPLLKEILGISNKKFQVTNKSTGTKSDAKTIILNAIPFFVVFILSIFSFILIMMNAAKSQEWSLLILSFWLLYNVFFTIICIYVIACDEPVRSSSVSRDKHTVTLQGANEKFATYSTKISEGFVDLYFDENQDFVKDEKYELTFDNIGSKNKLIVSFAETSQPNTYRFRVSKKSSQNFEFLNLVYNSKTDMPTYNPKTLFFVILWRTLLCRLFNIRPNALKDY